MGSVSKKEIKSKLHVRDGSATKSIDDSALLALESTSRGFLPPVMTEAQRDAISSPTEGLIIHNSDTNTLNVYSSGSWTAVGSGSGTGSGSKNYFENENFESDISGVSEYDDTGSYVDGTGGSASAISVSQTTTGSEVLEGVGSLKISKAASDATGEGVSFLTKALDQIDAGKTLYGSFAVQTPTFTDNSDISIKAYDVGNSAEITGCEILTSDGNLPSDTLGTVQFRVPTTEAMDGSTIRISLHWDDDNDSASAYDIFIDEVKWGPQGKIATTIITKPGDIPWTPTGSWTTNTTYSGTRFRVGNREYFQGKISLSGAPTSASLTLNLPVTIDTSDSGLNNAEQGQTQLGPIDYIDSATTSSPMDGRVYYDTTTTVQFRAAAIPSGTNNEFQQVTQSAPITWASGDEIHFAFSVPVVGYEGTVSLVDTADSLPSEETFIVNTGNGKGSTNTASRRFSNTEKDVGDLVTLADSAADGTSFTIKKRGLYSIEYTDRNGPCTYGISVNSNQLTSDIFGITASHRKAVVIANDVAEMNCASATVFLEAGDVVRAHVNPSAAPISTETAVRFSITKIESVKDTFLVENQDRATEKTLSSNFTTDSSDVSGLTFSNLVVDKEYLIVGQVAFTVDAADANISLSPRSASSGGGTQYGRIQTDGDSSNASPVVAVCIPFTAVSSSVYFRTGSLAAGSAIAGDGSKNNTFLRIIEVNSVSLGDYFA